MGRVNKVMKEEAKALFPLATISSLEKLFQLLISEPDPNLALLSIILGAVEHSLTCTSSVLAAVDVDKKTASSRGGGRKKDDEPQTSGPSSAAISRPSAVPTKKGLISKRRNTTRVRHISSYVVDDEPEPAPAESSPSPSPSPEKQPPTPTTGATSPTTTDHKDFPPLQLDIVLSLYEQFHANVYSAVDMDLYQSATLAKLDEDPSVVTTGRQETSTSGSSFSPVATSTNKSRTSHELMMNLTDNIWNALSATYVFEKPHLQSLYTFLTGNKLDSFGMAMAVVEACQLLRLNDVHLVLSEDHAWVSFGNGESCEITWHGKSGSDKRGEPIITDNSSWLYLGGQSIRCTRFMEIGAIVSALNPTITATVDSKEMLSIQYGLLKILYEKGHLGMYPMALATLADLTQTMPEPEPEPLQTTTANTTPDSKAVGVAVGDSPATSAVLLFDESIASARSNYNNRHIYPYTIYGGYLYRQQKFKEALEHWAAGAHVLSTYHYDQKADTEIYKEFLEITEEFIPSIMKQCSEGISAGSIIRDPITYGRLLSFFDGICLWEERSGAPIVHVIWAKHWASAMGKFVEDVRRRVSVVEGRRVDGRGEDAAVAGGTSTSTTGTGGLKGDDESSNNNTGSVAGGEELAGRARAEAEVASAAASAAAPAPAAPPAADDLDFLASTSSSSSPAATATTTTTTSVIATSTLCASQLLCGISLGGAFASDLLTSSELTLTDTLSSTLSASSSSSSSAAPAPAVVGTSLARLAAASGSILIDPASLQLISSLSPPPPLSAGAIKDEANNNTQNNSSGSSSTNSNHLINEPLTWTLDDSGQPLVTLTVYSSKMKIIGSLLRGEKFNSAALTLTLTAQTWSMETSTSAGASIGAAAGGRARRSRGGAGLSPAAATVAAGTRKRSQGTDQLIRGGGKRTGGGGAAGRDGGLDLIGEPVAAVAAATGGGGGGGATVTGGEAKGSTTPVPVSLPPKKRGRKI